MFLFSLDMGLSSSIGVATAARRSPSAISSFISSASLVSFIVANSTSAEMTISMEAMMKGSSIIQTLRASSAAFM